MSMNHFLDFLLKVRIVIGEVGGTLGLAFLIYYGVRKAWKDFVKKPISDDVVASPPYDSASQQARSQERGMGARA